MVQRFRTKTVEIEAVRFTGDNFDELYEWTKGNFRPTTRDDDTQPPGQVYDFLHTTWINVETGQWIVRGAKGEYYPCDDETFHWKYEEVTPQLSAETIKVNEDYNEEVLIRHKGKD